MAGELCRLLRAVQPGLPRRSGLVAGAASFPLADQHTLYHQGSESLAGFQAVYAEDLPVILILDKSLPGHAGSQSLLRGGFRR